MVAEVTPTLQDTPPEGIEDPTKAGDEGTKDEQPLVQAVVTEPEVKGTGQDTAEASLEGTPEWQAALDAKAARIAEEKIQQAETERAQREPEQQAQQEYQEAHTRRSQAYRTTMRDTVSTVTDWAKSELELGDSEAAALAQKVAPFINAVHSYSDDHQADLFNATAARLLTPEEQKVFFRPDGYANQQEAMHAMLLMFEQRAKAGVEVEKKAGNLFTKAQLQEQVTAKDLEIRRLREKTGEVPAMASNPTVLDGTAVANRAGDPATLEEAQQMHARMHPSGRVFTNAEMRDWRVRHNLPATPG